jgi:hypothetical protein
MKQTLREVLELQIEAYYDQIINLEDRRASADEFANYFLAAEYHTELKTLDRVITDLKRLM